MRVNHLFSLWHQNLTYPYSHDDWYCLKTSDGWILFLLKLIITSKKFLCYIRFASFQLVNAIFPEVILGTSIIINKAKSVFCTRIIVVIIITFI